MTGIDLFSTKELVQHVLTNSVSSRDCDRRLTANVWNLIAKQKAINLRTLNAFKLLNLYVSGIFPNPDHITRTRRALQEHHPELRGEMYNTRHGIAEEVRTTIHTLPMTL